MLSRSKFLFESFSHSQQPLWLYPFVPGVSLVFFGILVLFFPAILVAIVSFSFIMLGGIALFAAWKMRQVNREFFDDFDL